MFYSSKPRPLCLPPREAVRGGVYGDGLDIQPNTGIGDSGGVRRLVGRLGEKRVSRRKDSWGTPFLVDAGKVALTRLRFSVYQLGNVSGCIQGSNRQETFDPG